MKKYKVNYDRQKPSSEEILSRRNFDQLLEQYKATPGKVVHKPFWKAGWFVGAMATAAAVAVGVIIFLNQQDTTPGDTQQLANGATTRQPDTTGGPATFLAQQGKRRVAPPLKGIDVAFSSYKVSASRGGVITHPTGSKLIIPSNAFVDANGNRVSGNVDIRYREFRDQADIFLAGVPLQYDSGGVTYTFESAGMMEVAAFVNGQVVYLDKNKPVEVQYASSNPGAQFNLYRFDETIGNWTYLGKDEIRPVQEEALTPEQKEELINTAKETIAQLETGQQQAVVAAVNAIPVPEQPVQPKRADKSKHRFTVDFSVREFPEMATYSNVLFEVDESRGKFDRGNYDVMWESMQLSKGDQKERYVLTLKKGMKVVKLDVYPVFEGKNYESAVAAANEKFAAYESALDARKKAEAATRERYADMLNKQGLYLASLQVQNAGSTMDALVATEVMRVFTVSGMGIYNCDTPAKVPQGGNVLLSFHDVDGKPFVDYSSMYHVDREKNALFSYYANPQTGFRFDPSASNLVWAVKDGELYYADSDAFSALPVKGAAVMTMKPLEKQFATAQEMKTFFRIGEGV